VKFKGTHCFLFISQADIPGERLTLALEPEAAAVFTKEQALIRHSKDGKTDLTPFPPNSTVMVVDLGGKCSNFQYQIRFFLIVYCT
jgi:hypothetical protein